MSPQAPDARTWAVWENARGEPQPEAALVVSPRGAWFSTLLGTDDDDARLRMLAFLLDSFLPESALSAARRRVEDAEHRSGLPFNTFLASLEDPTEPESRRHRARQALADGNAAQAWDEADQLALFTDQVQLARIPAPPDGFFIGLWDHSGLGLYPNDWPRTLAAWSDAGFTDVFVYGPRSAPLPARAVEASRSSPVRFHAWHIVFSLEGLAANEIESLDRRGRLQRSASGQAIPWLCPTIQENREAEQDRILRLAGMPGITGVHLDYVRHPDPHHCFCAACRTGFEGSQGGSVRDWPDAVLEEGALRQAWERWRANRISEFVRSVSEAARKSFPSVQISAAVWPDTQAARAQLGQDWPRWLADGWVDFLAPMSYTENIGQLEAWTRKHTSLPGAEGRIWSGLGVASAHTRLAPIPALQQVRAAEEFGAAGIILFEANTTVQTALFPLLRSWTNKGGRYE